VSEILNKVLTANEEYARAFGIKSELPMPPGRRFAILTCMDARLDPAQFAGLSEGDAHVIRNAGGRASDDAIRSLVISHQLLGTAEWFVVHHSDCGMETFTNEKMKEGFGGVSSSAAEEAGRIDWLTISNQTESVLADVLAIRNHPLVPNNIPIYGYLFDVKTGKLVEIPDATKAGKVC